MTNLTDPITDLDPARPDDAVSVAAIAAELAAHYESEVTSLRELQLQLNHDDLTQAALRRVVGRLFSDSIQGLAVARGFSAAIGAAERGAEPIIDKLIDPQAAIAALHEWNEESRDAIDSVTLDLIVVDSLIARAEHAAGTPDHDTLVAVFDITRHLLDAAVSKLDRARPPTLPETR